jgi:hypothetical protein
VKPNTLTIASLLSIILLPFHVGGDVALGLDKGGSGLVFILVPILLLVACGTLLLAERSRRGPAHVGDMLVNPVEDRRPSRISAVEPGL